VCPSNASSRAATIRQKENIREPLLRPYVFADRGLRMPVQRLRAGVSVRRGAAGLGMVLPRVSGVEQRREGTLPCLPVLRRAKT
jgi:hypothetical protein